MRTYYLILLFFLLCSVSRAGLVTSEVVYKQGETELKGYLAYDASIEGKRPGVLVVHEWWGLNDYARMRTEQLAKMGYVAFAADMYGNGFCTTDRQKAAEQAGKLRGTPLLVERARAGLDVLLDNERVDRNRVAAIGFCFGGTTVLELAYSGADLKGVVSFHGGLEPPEDPGRIKASILVLHGADDPFNSREAVLKFQDTMRAGRVDWEMIYYGGAVHAFTNPDADKAGIEGVAYQAKAAKRSWKAMQSFFDEVLALQK